MDDRQLIADLLSALEYHTEQTRPIEFSKVAIEAAREYLQKPAQRKPQFKEFIKWAGIQGYDCAQTFNSDTGEWICLNPMTADLWRAWQAAHNIKENT